MKKKKLKEFLVPILTEEYKIRVVIGSNDDLAKYISKYTGEGYPYCLQRLENARGTAWDTLPDKHPLIAIDGDLPLIQSLATLPHEASHAIDYIMEFLGLEDSSGEFKGHGISAVMRIVLKNIKIN